MASFNSGLAPNVVKTALDDVFAQGYNMEKHPGHASAEDAKVFQQSSADNSAVIMEIFKGTGRWGTRSEDQDVPQATPRVGNQKTFNIENFSQAIDISKNLFDDNMHSVWQKEVKHFGRRAVTSRDRNAFAVYRNGFSSETTADAVALISNSHTNLNGDTVDNLLTPALAESAVDTAIVQLGELKAQDGELDGALPSVLLVPLAKFKLACEITGSELRSGTANNDLNVYSSKYGIQVKTSVFLGAAAGGNDNRWFLLSDLHSVYRFVRQGLELSMVDWRYQRNNNYIYKGEFREDVGAMSHEGIVGSDSTT